MTKFTPGPWEMECHAIDTEDCNDLIACIKPVNEVGGIAYLTLRQDELQANANLMAASPDLYNVAVYVRDNCDMDSVLQALVDKALARVGGAQ